MPSPIYSNHNMLANVFLFSLDLSIRLRIFAAKYIDDVTMCKFSESTKQKLGNTIVYIAHHTANLSKTKLLKLLYLMEERMALKYHVPFIGLPFEVWQAGPVAKDVFIDLSDGPFLLKDFVKTNTRRALCGIGRQPVPDCWMLSISMNVIIPTCRLILRKPCRIVQLRIIARV